MRNDYNFRFNELVIDYQLLHSLLGYDGIPLPEPFDKYLEQALSESGHIDDIRAACIVLDEIKFDEKGKFIIAGGHEFHIGKTLISELKGSNRLAFFICTAGKTICEKSAELLKGNDPVLGYIYDVLGTAIVDAAADRMQSFLREDTESAGAKITNRYSPGYCNWSVADQHKLFSIFGGTTCGVALTHSALMNPVKSISGVIGIGSDVKYREYQCILCQSENCVYRRIPGKY